MQLIARKWGIVAGLSGFIAIVMGALGAHAVADAHLAALVETASLYQLIHALAMLWLSGQHGKYLPAARWLFLIGNRAVLRNALSEGACRLGRRRQARAVRRGKLHGGMAGDCARPLQAGGRRGQIAGLRGPIPPLPPTSRRKTG